MTTYKPEDRNGVAIHVGDKVKLSSNGVIYTILSIGEHTGAIEIAQGMWILPHELEKTE